MNATPQVRERLELREIIKQHPVTAYIFLAYAISWAIALPLAASAQGVLGFTLPLWLHYLTAYGPMLAALLVTWLIDGVNGLRTLSVRLTNWRIGVGWLVFAAVSPVAFYALIATGVIIGGGAAPNVRDLGVINFLPPLGWAAWILWIVNSGLGEEVGWRGFALPRLQQRHSAFTATLMLGGIWAAWHLPFFFYLPNFRAMGLAGFPGFALGVLSGAVVLTWLYNSTRGSVLATALWHGAFNFVTASAAGQGTIAIVMSVVVMVWAVIIVLYFKPTNLAHVPRHIHKCGI